ncbi:uncharacterized protein LOC131613512 [Vicia villosa]|uniref:uncharacterized protein LOC131613512 n=1 Tax=Vicia villosa TaxID=3911 RepID=UPI00273AC571|nr:uncharacterized protein LOC131613512 [Vicia villosa]
MVTQSYADFTTNSANLFYLHPNENPSLVLVTPPLTDKNYHTWDRSMHITFISKNKDKFIDETLTKPLVSDPMFAPWIRCNTMVLAWIHHSISESITKSVLYINNVAGVWKNLQIRFSHGGFFHISDIQEDLYKFRQGTLDVSNYFTQLKVLWDELENYRPIPFFSCAIPCLCDYDDESLPDINNAFSLVIQQEREMDSVASSGVPYADSNKEVPALQVQTHEGNCASKQGTNPSRAKTQGSNAPRGNNRMWTHCGRTNHTVETCFTKHGYPLGYRNKAKPQGTSSSNAKNVSTASPQDSATPSFGFTKEQYDSILTLLQQSKSTPTVNSFFTYPFVMNTHSNNINGKNPYLWNLDTGATYHFSFDLSSFSTHKTIVPIHVSLSDCSQVIASISGTVDISPSFTLYNVLYVPSFNSHSKEMIDIASLHRGLYILDSTPSNFSIHNSSCCAHYNGLPSPLLESKCPYELLFKEPPSMIHLKYVHNLDDPHVETLTLSPSQQPSTTELSSFPDTNDNPTILYPQPNSSPTSASPTSASPMPHDVTSHNPISPVFQEDHPLNPQDNSTPPHTLSLPVRNSSRASNPPQ